MVYRNPGKGEIIPLHNNSGNQNCKLTEDVDLPYAVDKFYDTVAFGVLQGVPLICGGYNGKTSDVLDEKSECFGLVGPQKVVSQL